MPKELLERGEWDDEKIVSEWKEFRVNFTYAWAVMAILQERAHVLIEEFGLPDNDAHLDANYVLQVPSIKLKEWDLVEDDDDEDEEDD